MGRQMTHSPLFQDFVYYSSMILVGAALTYGLVLHVSGVVG